MDNIKNKNILQGGIIMDKEALEFFVKELLSGEEVRLYEKEHEIQFEKYLEVIGESNHVNKDYGFDYVVFWID